MSDSLTEVPVRILVPLALEAWAVRSDGAGLRVTRTGAGPERARRAAERIRQDAVAGEWFAVVGLCGALDPGLRPGDVVVPDTVRLPDGTRTPLSPAPVAALRCAGIDPHTGLLIGTDHVVRGAERRALARESGACVVDMETPWLVAALAPSPVTVLRVVLDAPGSEFLRFGMLFALVRALGRIRSIGSALSQALSEPVPGTADAAPEPASPWR